MGIQRVFVTGGTGYIGKRLIPVLAARGHSVRALVRAGSEARTPAGCTAVLGNALDHTTFVQMLSHDDVVVHLVGTPRPSPKKAREFQEIDLVSIRETAAAATAASVKHVVYVSVAHPAPIMHAYVDVRVRGEAILRASGVPFSALRPWYVLGPGHRWPYALMPLYWICERLPSTRETARRLGLVTLDQMVAALARAVDTAGAATRIIDVAAIRAASAHVEPWPPFVHA
jgi:uncharacterized protein YbjT (DUF2867 family)